MIAEIEMQRQAMEPEAGVGAASSGALRRLHELLDREREAQRVHGPSTGHPANIEALMIAIERVTKPTGVKSQRAMPGMPGSARPERQPVSLRSGTRIPPRNKGRRTMGRAGGR